MKKYRNLFGYLGYRPFLRSGRLIFLVGLLFIGLQSCKSDTKVNMQESTTRAVFQPDKSFAPFYDRFHSDSVYQLAHIQFPLQGLPSRTDSASLAEQDYFWDKESWIIQRDFDEKATGFTKHINAVSPEMVEETILDETGNFGLVRRFVKLDDEWYLIYFSGLGQINQ